ncbi:MAG: aminotransferase class IV [Campylobacterota bacterium]|nr:aminotransferase class IV [Campylobacterota bacterium]
MIQVRDILVQNCLVSNSYLETIKSVDGEIFHIDYHQQRYETVLSSFAIDSYISLKTYLNPPKNGLYRCRLVYSLDNSISVTYHKYKRREIKSLKLVFNDDIEYNLKSTNRDILDTLFQLRDECDESLIVQNSLITDTTIANIAFLKDGIWYTPKKPLLEGTTRARVLKEGKVVLKDISVDDIYSYEKVALLNAMIDFDIIAEKNIRKIVC